MAAAPAGVAVVMVVVGESSRGSWRYKEGLCLAICRDRRETKGEETRAQRRGLVGDHRFNAIRRSGGGGGIKLGGWLGVRSRCGGRSREWKRIVI